MVANVSGASVSGLALQNGNRYAILLSITAVSGRSILHSSAPFVVDSIAPLAGSVTAGSSQPNGDARWINSLSQMEASWSGFLSPFSGIHHFEVCFGSSAGVCNLASTALVPVNVTSLVVNADLLATTAAAPMSTSPR